MKGKRCRECEFFQVDENDVEEWGRCYRHPPTVVPNGAFGSTSGRPRVAGDDKACGEMHPKEERG